MKTTAWIMTAVMAVAVTAGGAAPVFAGDEAVPAATNAVKHQTICPVMGGGVDKTIFVDSHGKRIYMCCNGCVKTVKENPEKYIKKMEAEGITLDKTPSPR